MLLVALYRFRVNIIFWIVSSALAGLLYYLLLVLVS
ncbi:hypothetical protein SAMN00120144_2489 [Hymenobacter roseosalivarius DSM 11622]|uniref:Uncharacterized protein n=1 Tax=Hymenobacter roseosalivarius DSM 11622 TaxID=645990 RepID=A0A1W1VEW3_9BACT|nr:hypothetical protein SAMN00120144_2489 [Hymenobacter roseosalivarius DSM 11622]